MNTTLTVLNLPLYYLRYVGGAALVRMLESNTTLITLNLGWNYLGEGFGEIVLDLLKKNTSLTSLGIDSDIDYYSDIQGILSEREPLIEGPSVKVAIPSIPR